ncbi:MAG: hypothetical protein JOZ30_08410 [Hyphomicrobiales bacterium]|nr:hypothetical protein [Hyphomicrobiales bacterium]
MERELLAGFDAKDERRLRKLLRKATRTISLSARGEEVSMQAHSDLDDR